MKNAIFITLIIVLYAGMPRAQSDVDHEDDVLLAYWIPEEVEETFDPSDGKISDFWNIWDTYESNGWDQEHIDKLKLTPSQHGGFMLKHGDGVSGDDDAQIEVRVCWGDKGLYVMARCWDDLWVDKGIDSVGPAFANWAYDYCEILLEKLTRQEMIEAAGAEDPAIIGQPGRYLWTKTFTKLFYRFGGAEPSTEFNYYRYEEQIDYIFKYTLTFDEAGDLIPGFGVELVQGEETQIRNMEWLIPWAGATNGGMDKPQVYDKIGVTFGYNDNDGEPLKCDHLRKYPCCGQWVRTYNIDQVSGDTLDTILHPGYLMDLEFVHGLPPDDPEPVLMPLADNMTVNANVMRTDYFTLNGMLLLRAPGNRSNNGAFIRRSICTDGSTRNRIFILPENTRKGKIRK
jgi:hypothetical protein